MEENPASTYEGPAISKEFQDLVIDKTHQSLSEVGKSIGQAFLTYLLLLSLEALLVFSKGAEGTVAVPLLQLTLSKPYASATILVLSCAVLYWLWTLININAHFTHELDKLFNSRYGLSSGMPWYMNRPSPHWIFGSLTAFGQREGQKSKFLSLVEDVFFASFLAANFILPFVFAWRIAASTNGSTGAKVVACIIISILLAPSAIAVGSPTPGAAKTATIEKKLGQQN